MKAKSVKKNYKTITKLSKLHENRTKFNISFANKKKKFAKLYNSRSKLLNLH